MRRRQRVAAALDVNGRLAVRVGDEGLRSGAALGIIRGEGDGRARDGQTEVVDHVRGQRVGRDVVDAQRRALALAHDEGEVGVGRAVLAELGDSGLAEGDGRAVYLVLPVLLKRLAACADVLEGRAVRRVEGDGDVLIAAGRGVRVEIDRGGSDFIDRRGIRDGQRAARRGAARGDEGDGVAALALFSERLAQEGDRTRGRVVVVVLAALEHRAAELDRIEQGAGRQAERYGDVGVVCRVLIFVERDLRGADRAERGVADDDADGGLGAVLKAQLRGVGADGQSGQIGLVDADAVLVGENVVIRTLTQVLAADGDAGQVVLVRTQQKFVGKGDVVLVVDVDGQGGRGDRNARRGGGGLARDGGGDAAGELYLSRLHDKLAAARVQLCGLHRAVAGDGGLGIRGQLADERAAGGDDGGSGFGVQIPDRSIERKARALAGHGDVGEAACICGKTALRERGGGLHLCGADIGRAGRDHGRLDAHRVGDDEVHRGHAVERDVAAADDDIALDGDVVQVDVAGEHALCDVEIALDGRVRQRAGRRDGDVLRVAVEGGGSVLPAGLAERRAEVEVQDLGDLAALEVALRLEGAVGVAVDVALRDRLGDVICRVGGDLGLVGEHIKLGRGRGRCILVQAAEDGRGLLAGQRALRVHPVVARAVDVAVLDGDLDGLIVRIRAFDIGKADGRLFGEVKRAVDVAHEFPARDRGLGGIVAGRGGGVDDAELVERGHIGLRPVRVDVGRERCRDSAGEQGRRQKGGEKSFQFQK